MAAGQHGSFDVKRPAPRRRVVSFLGCGLLCLFGYPFRPACGFRRTVADSDAPAQIAFNFSVGPTLAVAVSDWRREKVGVGVTAALDSRALGSQDTKSTRPNARH